MTNAATYFDLARTEEKSGNDCSALILYLFSFCSSFNSGGEYPYGTIAKIRTLQKQLDISDDLLTDSVRSYGPLSDAECRNLLLCSIEGNLTGIRAILSGHTGENNTEEKI